MGRVSDLLRSDEKTAGWLADLETADGPDIMLGLPSAVDLPEVLTDLTAPHEDVGELVALRAQIAGDPELRRLLERCVRVLVRDMGTPDAGPELPRLPPQLGAVGRYFYVFVFIAALPHVRAYHRGRGIPDDVSRRTLADLGRQLAVHRRWHGTGGLLYPWWLRLHFRGEIYQLGRLQFQRVRAAEGGLPAAAGAPVGPGDTLLSLHIPAFSGPLSPAACDASLDRARSFFPRHFPEEPAAVAICHSWLLDPELGTYLPDDANIVRFQRRFTLAPADESRNDDADTIGFVFGTELPPDADALPRRTALERAVGDHLRAGRHWRARSGWFRL